MLPAASWLEFDDLVVPYFHRALAAQVKATEPLGQALPNSEIFRRLAAALGLPDPPLLEPDEEIIARTLEGTGTGLDFAELASHGTVWTPSEAPAVQFGDGHYPTASGRIELVSEAAEADGHGRLPRPEADERPAAGRLRLLSPASPWALNSSFSNDERVARRSGALTLSLTAADAATFELRDGALARVTKTGPTSTRLPPQRRATWARAPPCMGSR